METIPEIAESAYIRKAVSTTFPTSSRHGHANHHTHIGLGQQRQQEEQAAATRREQKTRSDPGPNARYEVDP
jgi:hypothetical protein